MKIELTDTIVDDLELVLAVVHNDIGSYSNSPDYQDQIIDAHTRLATICEEAGGEVDYIE